MNAPLSPNAIPSININEPLHLLVDFSEKHLASHPTIFQKSGELVSVVVEQDDRVAIKPLKPTSVRYILSQLVEYIKDVKDDVSLSCHPPSHIARCILDKDSWKHALPLRAVSPFPPMGPDGKISFKPGYDANTQVYYTGTSKCFVKENPTRQDAVNAVHTLLDVVSDFPFASPVHKSAWLAALLSPLSRFAHKGNIPIVLIQANAARSGKTRLAHIVSYITAGNECPFITHTKSEDTVRKRILAYLREGRSMALIDNVIGEYGGANVNALTTSGTFEDRILNQSKMFRVANDTAWFITGNNLTLAPDTAERCLNIRLRSDEEHPHLRTDFQHKDLFGYIKENQEVLLGAALTILKAYIGAGMPEQDLSGWGSFESWSNLVRGSLVWVGQPDPALTREELETESDSGRMKRSELVGGMYELQIAVNASNGLTAREASDIFPRFAINCPSLRSAFENISDKTRGVPKAHTLGRHLREAKDQIFNGKVLRASVDLKNGHRWFVEIVS